MADSDAGDSKEPQRWENLVFPMPIIGFPPNLQNQIQIFNNTFTGNLGNGNVPTLELSYVTDRHLALIAILPFQIGSDGQPNGFRDLALFVQYLAAGSLRMDNMLSVGITTVLPTGRGSLSLRDWYVGPFAFAGQRFWHRLTLELNVAALVPITRGESARQLGADGLIALLLTKQRAGLPLYLQVEANTTTFLGGTSGLPQGATRSPVESVFIAPELSAGPFHTPLSDGTWIAGGVFVNLAGDPAHRLIYTLTVAFGIPNRYGY
ncbi:hypothetical protein AKJ08_2959 [Vulgatibacter incomptus]|uniref:Uncharacterized protein n=1 Tax=Vulgatibacter incomptus TaxID=1391653 RepID=A0A0K1PGD7_9BACT|nr:hypothetical protein AKJ08_2959 [Vulgatibacter incomptus]